MRKLTRQKLLSLLITVCCGFPVVRAILSEDTPKQQPTAQAASSVQAPRAALERRQESKSPAADSGDSPAGSVGADSEPQPSSVQPGRGPDSAPGDELPNAKAGADPGSLTGAELNFDPVSAARAAQLLMDQISTESSEEQNYSAAVGQLLSSLGYANPATGTRRMASDTVLPQATLHEPYCQSLAAAESGGISTARLVSGFVPKGLVLNQTTGSLCGSPNETGIFRFTADLQYGGGDLFRKTFRLVVIDGPRAETEGELRIVTLQLETGAIGAEYVFQLEAQGGKLPYSWSVLGLPDELELDPPSGLIAGSPENAGEFPLELQVRDAEGAAASLALTLLIRSTPVFITTQAIDEGVANEPYQARFEAQGGMPPYRWELAGSLLPDGLALASNSGVLDGTPTEQFEALIRIRVVDTDGKSDTAELPLQIRASSLRIVTQALADGFTATKYQFALAAEGGSPPYRWSSSSVLPSGIFLSAGGVLSGSPLVAGDYILSVTVSDDQAQAATRTVRLRVQSSEPESEETPEPAPSPEPTGDQPIAPLEPVIELPGVSQLQAFSSDNKVGLVWNNPVHIAYERTVIVRGDSITPQTIADGEVIYSGAGTTALDLTAENGRTYVYGAFAQYADGTKGVVQPSEAAATTPHTLGIDSKPDPFIDGVVSFLPIDAKCYGCTTLPEAILGQPHGQGETLGNAADVVSLGARENTDSGGSAPYGGSITVAFTDNIIYNGSGPDFTIFENAFRLTGTDDYFVEPAVVEVSADGEHFYRFPFDFVPHFDSKGNLNLFNPFSYALGFAGVHPVYANPNIAGAPSPLNTVRSGGDQFDLSDLPGAPLAWARIIRITSTGDRWLTDLNGDPVRHSNTSPTFGASGRGNSGFDLDAVAAVNY